MIQLRFRENGGIAAARPALSLGRRCRLAEQIDQSESGRRWTSGFPAGRKKAGASAALSGSFSQPPFFFGPEFDNSAPSCRGNVIDRFDAAFSPALRLASQSFPSRSVPHRFLPDCLIEGVPCVGRVVNKAKMLKIAEV
jgi:hypothetical protein